MNNYNFRLYVLIKNNKKYIKKIDLIYFFYSYCLLLVLVLENFQNYFIYTYLYLFNFPSRLFLASQ